jgi:glycosyltransferase involved in cell wall biosynthesis
VEIRLAYFSPLKPVQSGISDYSADLLPYLAEQFDTSLVTDYYQPALTGQLARLPIMNPEEFWRRRRDFFPCYQMGNSVYHQYMLACMKANPGLLTLHDVNLRGLFNFLAAARTIPEGWHIPGSNLEPELNSPCVNLALGVVVHSSYAVSLLRKKYPGLYLQKINMGVAPPPPDIDQQLARQQLGISSTEFAIGSFGHIIPKKRIHIFLEAFAAFSSSYPKARYYLVGKSADHYPLEIIRRLGLDNRVVITGYTDTELFNKYLHAMDVCVNLRYPEDGETSATMIRAFAAAKPVLYTPCGAGAELPAGIALPIPANSSEIRLITTTLIRLCLEPLLSKLIGEKARRYYNANHLPERTAADYIRMITTLSSGSGTGFGGNGSVGDSAGRGLGTAKQSNKSEFMHGGNGSENRSGSAGNSGNVQRPWNRIL